MSTPLTAFHLDFTGTNFSKSEWPDHENTLRNLCHKPVQCLFDVRKSLPANHSLYPSPIIGAHYREKSSGSRHSTHMGTKLSIATDFFCHRHHAAAVWLALLQHSQINGVGIYRHSLFKNSDKKFTLLHLDTRPKSEQSIWIGDRWNSSKPFTYITLANDPQKFFRTLSEDGFFS